MPRITKRAVDAIRPVAKDSYLWDDELPGFGVKVTPAARKVISFNTVSVALRGAPAASPLGSLGPANVR